MNTLKLLMTLLFLVFASLQMSGCGDTDVGTIELESANDSTKSVLTLAVLEGVGSWSAQLSMTREQIEENLGSPIEAPEDHDVYVYDGDTIHVWYQEQDDDEIAIQITFISWRVEVYSGTDVEGNYNYTVGAGFSREQVIDYYGTPTEERGVVLWYNPYRTAFQIDATTNHVRAVYVFYPKEEIKDSVPETPISDSAMVYAAEGFGTPDIYLGLSITDAEAFLGSATDTLDAFIIYEKDGAFYYIYYDNDTIWDFYVFSGQFTIARWFTNDSLGVVLSTPADANTVLKAYGTPDSSSDGSLQFWEYGVSYLIEESGNVYGFEIYYPVEDNVSSSSSGLVYSSSTIPTTSSSSSGHSATSSTGESSSGPVPTSSTTESSSSEIQPPVSSSIEMSSSSMGVYDFHSVRIINKVDFDGDGYYSGYAIEFSMKSEQTELLYPLLYYRSTSDTSLYGWTLITPENMSILAQPDSATAEVATEQLYGGYLDDYSDEIEIRITFSNGTFVVFDSIITNSLYEESILKDSYITLYDYTTIYSTDYDGDGIPSILRLDIELDSYTPFPVDYPITEELQLFIYSRFGSAPITIDPIITWEEWVLTEFSSSFLIKGINTDGVYIEMAGLYDCSIPIVGTSSHMQWVVDVYRPATNEILISELFYEGLVETDLCDIPGTF